ncbi:hypothetical protein [Agreia sp. Leaf210]|uniref:hypothetical protein n=1 Tax=Agreia sp. Leaf210 TaxID=1735682 RepID=UPI0006FB8143|nr:hypothetical protein [Agreia sp. Leaf210]KQM57511.1 hypothetical protein ASE64_15225 [Agreia sp. Leaf210]
MPAASNLTEYLSTLPADRRDAFNVLMSAVSAVPVPPSNNSFVFLAGQTEHPEFDDAESVFWKAVEQLQLRNAVSDGELPLVYWGFHSIDLLLRRRSNGILVTDRTVYLDDVGNSSAQFAIESIDPASIRVAGESLEVAGASIGLAQIAGMLEPTTAVDAAAYLSAVVAAVQVAGRSVSGHGSAPSSDEATQTVEQLVLASRMGSDFRLPARPKDAKALNKLSAKWNLPADEVLLVSLSSATFAGVYGIAITNKAVYSKDLMEPLFRTALEDVEGFVWEAETKMFRVSNDHAAPTHPAITDDNRDYAASLLHNLARAAAHE